MTKLISVAIDSPAAAGAGTQAKLIAKHYNLFYLDTGKIYRFVGFLKIKYKKKFNYNLVKKKINNLKISQLQKKKLLSNDVSSVASVIAKDKRIREIVHNFQTKCAYKPPKNFNGSILDGRGSGGKSSDCCFSSELSESSKAPRIGTGLPGVCFSPPITDTVPVPLTTIGARSIGSDFDCSCPKATTGRINIKMNIMLFIRFIMI